MPSPLGHAMAGLVIAWSAERLPARVRPIVNVSPPLLVAGALLAVSPDFDLLYAPVHRTISHSVAAVALVTIFTGAVTRWVTGRVRLGIALVCGAAYGSHLLLDWLGVDISTPRGIQMFWPFSDEYFLSGWDLLRGTERARPLSRESILYNARTAIQEIATFGPILAILWFTRRRGILRGATRPVAVSNRTDDRTADQA